MVRRRFGVGYDPSLPQLRPIARPFDFSLSFPNYQNARPNVIDISEIAGIAAGVRHVDQRNQYEKQQEQDAQDKQNQDRATEQAAEFIAKNAELAKGDKKTLDEAYAAGKLPEWADPRFQKGFFALRGAAVGRDAVSQFENDAAEFGPRAATMPKPEADAEWEKIRGKAIKAIESDPSYQNEYGKRSALAVFEQHEPGIRARAVQAMGSETRKVAYQDMGNNFRRLAKDFANQVDGDSDVFVADFEALQQLAHEKFGMRSSKELALASTRDELLSMENKDAARRLLANISDAKINGADGRKAIKDDEEGSAWARDVGIKLDEEAYSQERRRYDLFSLRQVEATRAANHALYRPMYNAAKQGHSDKDLLALVDAYVQTLPAQDQQDFGPAILGDARKDWADFRNEDRAEVVAQDQQYKHEYEAISGAIRSGIPSEEAIAKSDLPPGMKADLRDEDAAYQTGEAVVHGRGSIYEKEKALINKPITDAFRGDHRETQSARYAALRQAQPLIDKFQDDVYAEAIPYTDPTTGKTSTITPAALNEFIRKGSAEVTRKVEEIVTAEHGRALERMSLEVPGDDKEWQSMIANRLVDSRLAEHGYSAGMIPKERRQGTLETEGVAVTDADVSNAYAAFLAEYRKDAKAQITPGLEPEVFEQRMKESAGRAFLKVAGTGPKEGAASQPSKTTVVGKAGSSASNKEPWRQSLDEAALIYNKEAGSLNFDNYNKYVDGVKSLIPSQYADTINPPTMTRYMGGRFGPKVRAEFSAGDKTNALRSAANAAHATNFDKSITEEQRALYAGTIIGLSGLLKPENIESGEYKSFIADPERIQMERNLQRAKSFGFGGEVDWIEERLQTKTIKLDMTFDPYMTDFGFKNADELYAWKKSGRLEKFITNPRIQLPATEIDNFIAYQLRAIGRRSIQ